MFESPNKRNLRKRPSSAFAPNTIAQDNFLFKESQENLQPSKVSLYSKHITIEPEQRLEKCRIQIDFDTVFSILKNSQTQEEEKAFVGIPIGIKFQKFEQSIQILNYEQPEVVDKWSKLLGKQLNQRNFHQIFKPIKKIGKGNFATVYLVIKNQDKQPYAVKAFSKQVQYADERGKESLQNQTKIMRALDHKNLMKIEGVFETDNSIYLVVEYLQGGLLYDKIKKRQQFSCEQVLQIMRSILCGVAHMHDKRIMHRDLKPENILFRNQDSYECVIADFGLATFADIDEYIYTRCGTPGYVAPQISSLKDKQCKYDPVCDMFSIGVIFHLLVLGSSPFPGKQCDQVLQQNRDCNIDFSGEVYLKLHPTWLNLLQRMLQKDPHKRITAKQALAHQFFIEASNNMVQEPQKQKIEQCESPLMITKNNNRKRNIKLRDDSCLKFKMKENIAINKDEEQHIQRINSPLRKIISRSRIDRGSGHNRPSNFRQ